MAEGVRPLGCSLTLSVVVAVPGEVGEVGAKGSFGREGEAPAVEVCGLKWLPPGRMDSMISDLATWMRRLSSTVQRPASKRSWAINQRGQAVPLPHA